MPFIAQLTELIASCKPTGAYGLVPEMFARAVVDVRGAPNIPYAGDLGPNQWWRVIPSASAQPPPPPAHNAHPPMPMPINAHAGPSHQYQHPYPYPQHYARSLSPQPPPAPPPQGRKRTASAAQLDPRSEHGGRLGRDNYRFEIWTGDARAGSSSGQPGTGASGGGRAPAKYARYNPDEPGPPKGYELCTDEQSRCDRCRERGIECWKGRKRKRASGACWNCHKLKRPCSMAKDWFASKPFAAMSEPYETDPGSVVVLQLNEAGRLLSPRAAALAEEQAYAQRHQQQAYASSSHSGYHDDRPYYGYAGRPDNPHHNGSRARSSAGPYAGSSPPDTAYSSPAPHPLPLPPIPDPYASYPSSRRTSVSTPYAQHPRYYPPPPGPADIPPPPPPNNIPLAIPPPPPPERIHYSTHVQAPIPLDAPPDSGPRPIPPPPPPELPHYHGLRRSATPHGSSSYTRSDTHSGSASVSAPATAPSASASSNSQARSSSSQSHSSHEYPYAPGPPQGYYDREPPPLPHPPERYREPAERYYDSPPPRTGPGAYYEREPYAAVYPPPPGYAYPPPEAYPRPGHYPHPHPHPQAHGRYNPLVDARHDPYASRPASRAYPPPPLPPPPHDSRAYPPLPLPGPREYTPQPYGTAQPARPRKRADSSPAPPAIPPPPPLEWPDHPPRTAYERRRSTRETVSRDRDTVSGDRDTAAPEVVDNLRKDENDGQVDEEQEDRDGEMMNGDADIDGRRRMLLSGESGADRDEASIGQRGRMLLASTHEGQNGEVEIRTSSPAPMSVSMPEDRKGDAHTDGEKDMDQERDVRSPRPARTLISTPPPPPPLSSAPPGSTGTHTPGSAAAAERPACARPPTSSASTASAGGTVTGADSSPPRGVGGTAKRPWLI
ncbi:hypothetical protein PENSPDRAFT_689033 [Peniophora sp. CONT]|nr:hypothetical protein PENSPDRAFT_689033 [Peniophora sp. CONT]